MRIPPKGHPNRGRYWRDRELLRDLQSIRTRVIESARDGNEKQGFAFRHTLNHLDVAITSFEAGWQESYL